MTFNSFLLWIQRKPVTHFILQAKIRRKVVFLVPLAALCLLTIVSISQFLSDLDDTVQDIPADDFNCGCPRKYQWKQTSLASVCSIGSTLRGNGQKVVSYSIFGKFNDEKNYRKYWGQIEDRIREIHKHYSGWVMRLYHNTSRKATPVRKHLCRLYCEYPHLDLCYTSSIFVSVPKNASQTTDYYLSPDFLIGTSDISSAILVKESEVNHQIVNLLKRDQNFDRQARTKRISISYDNQILEGNNLQSFSDRLSPTMWRFLPMIDPLVDVFLIRDIDSTILEREVSAVQQWLNETTAILHVMRDHPSHNGVILAGMWGASRNRGKLKLNDLFNKIIKYPPRDFWNYDQVMLHRIVWPEMKDSVAIHDSYFCQNKRFTANNPTLPFPTRRQGTDFVSWGILRNEERSGIVPCPKACRPKNHQDWIYC